MNYTFFDFLELLGSLGIFLYGMKVMSEGLQKVAGDRLRSILTAMTTNRVMGVFTGVLITALIQSSSATTVMVVSFVNAGLLSLAQSITVIMGANVGTTVTAWLISLLGFKFSISALSLPLIGLSLPLLFSSRSHRRSWGEFIVGFSLLFMGLDFLKDAVPDIKSNPEILSFLSQYTDMGYLSVFLFLGIGTLLTIIVQSSSATMAITLIMCSKGWISFEIAAAMVMGENIGTTITANLAALSANVSAKRAAMAHLLFNIFGVVWLLIFFYPYIGMVSSFIERLGAGDPNQLMQFVKDTPSDIVDQLQNGTAVDNPELASLVPGYVNMQVSVSYALSLFHTIFNVINVLVMIWFVNAYVYIVTKIVRNRNSDDEEFQLKYISNRMLSTSELSLLQAKKEIVVYSERTQRMFGMVGELLRTKEDTEAFSALFSRIEKYEKISDHMEVEIANYLYGVSDGRLSLEGKMHSSSMLTIVTEIESVADSCFHIARTFVRKSEAKVNFTQEMTSNIEIMYTMVDDALDIINSILAKNDLTEADMCRVYNKETEINNMRNQLRAANIENINEKKYDYQAGTYYMDVVLECEKLGDYIVNVLEAVKEKRLYQK